MMPWTTEHVLYSIRFDTRCTSTDFFYARPFMRSTSDVIVASRNVQRGGGRPTYRAPKDHSLAALTWISGTK